MVVGENKGERSTALLQRSELLDSYQKNVVSADPNKREHGYKHIEPFVMTFLSEMEHQRKLSRQLLDIFDASVKEIPGWTPQRGHDTFKHLERYAHHMLDAPWKSEFKTMKIFSGFFKVYIEPNLRKAEDIFYMIGYEVQKDSNGRVLDTLILQKPINRRTLAFIASECYFAAIECVIMMQIMHRTDMQYRVQDVYKSRVNCTGGLVKCVKWLTENCVPNSNINGSLRSVKEEEEENEWTRQIERKRQSRSLDDLLGRRASQPAKTPELRRGDSDDTSRSPHPLSTHMKDWAEVNLSNLYNGDDSPDITSILRPKRQVDGPGRDSGYGSHYIAEMTDPGPSISEAAETTSVLPDEVDHVLQCNDLYSGSQPNSHVSVDHSEEYDMYKAGTAADHVQRSLKFIEKIDTSPNKSRPQSSPGCADDWSHIRESLRKEYGDKYFEGDRGCILKQSDGGQPQARKSMPVELQHNHSGEGNAIATNTQVKQPPPILPKPLRGKPPRPPNEPVWNPVRDPPARDPSARDPPARDPVVVVRDPVKDQVRDPIRDQIRDSMRDHQRDPVNHVRDPVRDPARDRMRDPAQDQMRDPVRDQLRDPMRIQPQTSISVSINRSRGPSPSVSPSGLAQPLMCVHTCGHNVIHRPPTQKVVKPDLIEEDPPLPPPPELLTNDLVHRHFGHTSDSDSDGFGEMGSKTIPPCRRHHHQSHDPFIENCNRNTNTILRARPNSAILEDQFKSILLAKDDRASSYYTTPTFSTFGKQNEEETESEEWPDPPEEAMAVPGTWSCDVCTFANQRANGVCEMCGKSRVKTETLVSLDGPPCPNCTYVNKPGADQCEICSVPLHNSEA